MLSEAVKGQDTGIRKAMAAERKAGDKKKSVKAGESYATFQKQRIKWADQTSKAKKHIHGSIDETIERQAKDRKKLSQPHSVSGSRRDHSHDVDSALTDHVPRKGKGRVRPASKKEMRVSAMRDAGIKQEEVVHEVAPPGWGHTKAEKEKTKPNKPKSKIGGSAAAFKRALDDGRFKGLPGDKTKKEKTASMFKLMWAMKKKGDKPHYKPGTNKKYKKYQEEEFVLEREDSPYEKASDKALDKKYGYGTSHDKGPKTGFGRASNRATAAAVLKDIRRRKSKSTSETRADAAHKGWSHTARTSKDQTPEKKATRKKLADTPYKKLPKDEQEKDQVAADAVKKEYDKRKKINETLSHKDSKKLAKASVLSSSDDPKDQDRARARQTEIDYKDLLRQRKKGKVGVGKSMRTEELTFEGWKDAARSAIKRVAGKKDTPKHDYGRDAGAEAAKRLRKKDHEKVNFLDPDD